MRRKEGVEAELVGVSERLGVAGGHERARRRRRVCSVAARERARGEEELGEAPEPTNLTKTAGGSEVEDDVDGGDAARPGPRGSLRR